MKSILQLLFIISCITHSFAENYPALEVSESMVNLGKMQQNERISFVFTIYNKGKSPLKILKVDPGCQCTYIHDFETEIAPSDSMFLRGIVETAYLSNNFEKMIVLTTNDPENTKKQLLITGTVHNNMEFVPHLLQYSNMFKDSGVIKRKVKLSHIQGKEFSINKIKHDCNYLKVIKEDTKSFENNLTFLLDISKIPQSELSFFGITVEFILSSSDGISKEYFNVVLYNDKKSTLNYDVHAGKNE